MPQSRREFLGTAALSSVALSTQAASNAPISIDVGRQLFVDDFLIADTNLRRTFHKPRLYEVNPILKPETPMELNGGYRPVAVPFSDAVIYDPKDRLFKMWYHAGWYDGVAYAISEDGLKWTRPSLDIEPGTNRVVPARKGWERNGCTVWLDHEATDPQQRFKVFTCFRHKRDASVKPAVRHGQEPRRSGTGMRPRYARRRMASTGAIRSTRVRSGITRGCSTTRSARPGSTASGRAGRRAVCGLTASTPTCSKARCRSPIGAQGPDVNFWLSADELDLPDPELGYRPELYKVDAGPCESLMIALLALYKGIPEPDCPKINDLTVAFSRQGFRFERPDRTAFLACSRQKGTWNRGYLYAAGGICLIVGDQLYFYFGAWSGISPQKGEDIYAGGSTGVAMLRRDGFASMDGPPTAIPPSIPLRKSGR